MSTDSEVEGLVAILQGFEQKRAFEEAARDEKKQAAIISRESEEEAKRVSKAQKKARKKQKLQLLKSGVRLEDTPLLVLEESATESAKEVGAIRSRGQARAAFGRKKGQRLKKTGRRALVTGLVVGGAKLSQDPSKESE